MKRPGSPDLTQGQVLLLRQIAEQPGIPRRVSRRAIILLLAYERRDVRNSVEVRQLSDHGIAAKAGVCADTVRSTIRRLAEEGFEAAVYDKPFVRKMTEEAEQLLLDLVRSDPPPGAARWTLELLAEKLRDLRVVDSISDTSVWDILQKKGIRIERARARGTAHR